MTEDTTSVVWICIAAASVLLLVVDRMRARRRNDSAAARLERLISAHPDPRVRKMFRRVAEDIRSKRLRG